MTGAGMLARGPYIPHHPSLWATLAHSFVASVGWHAGASVFERLGWHAVLLVAVVALAWWVMRRRTRGRRW